MLNRVMKDLKTLTGKNVHHILKSIDSEDIMEVKVNKVKKTFKFAEIDEQEKFRVEFIKEITNIKNNIIGFDDHEDNFNNDELNEILNYLSSC